LDLQGPDFSDSRDPIFSDFRDRFEILGSRIGSLKRLKKNLHYYVVGYSQIRDNRGILIRDGRLSATNPSCNKKEVMIKVDHFLYALATHT